MSTADLIKELDEGNARLKRILEILQIRQAADRAMTPAQVAELRWLERDYQDERDGDWTR